VPFCGEVKCEEEIKALSKKDENQDAKGPSMGAKSLCIPFKQPSKPLDNQSSTCIRNGCQSKPKNWTLFGRSY